MAIAQRTGIRSLLLAAVVSLLGTIAGCGGGGGGTPLPIAQQTSVVVGDFNGDGRVDLAFSTAFVSGPLSQLGQVEVFVQDPFRPGFFPGRGSSSWGATPCRLPQLT